MSDNVRYKVRAEYYNIVDQWWYDDEAKAREKYAELLVTRPKWGVTLSAVTVRRKPESPG